MTHLGKKHETRELEVTREIFEKVNMELFGRCLNLVKSVAETAKKNGSPVGAILATGGSSQIPYLRDRLKSGMGIVSSVRVLPIFNFSVFSQFFFLLFFGKRTRPWT